MSWKQHKHGIYKEKDLICDSHTKKKRLNAKNAYFRRQYLFHLLNLKFWKFYRLTLK